MAHALRTRRGLGRWAQTWAGVATVLVLAELASRTGLLPQRYFPPVTEMFTALFAALGEPWFWLATGQTLQGWVLGLGIAALLAVPAGMLLGTSVVRYRAFRAVIEFLRPIPSVALVPLAILVYGAGLESKVFLAVFAAFWPLLIQTLYGMQDVDPVAVDTARAFRLTRAERITRVVLPGAVPYVATGLRISSSVALILAVTAELVIGSPGLGREINAARVGGAADLLYALIIVTGLIGWGLNSMFAAAERRVLHWHPSQRGAR
ncbi:ABC transporter permease [Prauserella muralis]|uniref:ABC transporter permease n=1 Tax=Prauserella muralis TaxID=588067 RepID=A0A2V4APC5_9PSEU|nr:ABC transporter permease [Prauserella muralis]PXY22308.1 ABC transporter permease [Prauserella muralis]TWE27957.1 ABC-type nitrate/sulfonate/bicarbonate transport system permease component [Prauserella muralis]